jgi:hypothetical protein
MSSSRARRVRSDVLQPASSSSLLASPASTHPFLARPALSLPSEPPQLETPAAHLFDLPLSPFLLPDRSFFPLLTRRWDGLKQRGCTVSPGCRTSACRQGRGRAALLSRVVLLPFFACLTFHTCVTLVVLLLASFYLYDYRSYISRLPLPPLRERD